MGELKNKKRIKNNFPLEFIRSTWLGHDIKYGKEFRCKIYNEHLFWNNDFGINNDLEEWSFMLIFSLLYHQYIINDNIVWNYNRYHYSDEYYGYNNFGNKDNDDEDLVIRIMKKPIK